MKVLSIDPGTSRFAASLIARVDGPKPWHFVKGETITRDRKATKDREARMGAIIDLIEDLGALGPQVVVYEVQSTGWGGYSSRNHGVHETIGMARSLARRKRVPFVLVQPTTVKRFVAQHGHADKDSVAAAVRVLCSGLPDKMSEHLSDAIAIGICGARGAS